MTLKWRFSGGILFSLLLHFFLLSALLYWYPGMIGRSDQPWQEWSQFLAENILPSGTVGKTIPETSEKIITSTLILFIMYLGIITLHSSFSKQKEKI